MAAIIDGMVKTIKKWLIRAVLTAGAITLLAFTDAPPNSVQGNIAAYATLIIFSPFLIGLFLVICFWIYHWLKHGDPFYESGDPVKVIYRGEYPKKREKKLCPICKIPTMCRVTKSKNGRMYVHVVRS